VEPPDCDDWLALTAGPLPVEQALAWVGRPDCGATVVFCGNVRDHADGRPGVTGIDYSAYETHVVPKLAVIAEQARSRWPALGRLAMLHRVGFLALGETSVVVAAGAPHRGDAFDAARFAIDTLKATVPIWKHEYWEGGQDWAVGMG